MLVVDRCRHCGRALVQQGNAIGHEEPVCASFAREVASLPRVTVDVDLDELVKVPPAKGDA